ncbi:MAG: ATP-binding cassette domain-containing protein [Nitrospirae bacterium]|nr:ATP-binding cassette domain-containing protein [Nitrospirota bacterium]NTW65292.1 ATP-binding cassette domain-containing protein [Nitrospirota bacterium]
MKLLIAHIRKDYDGRAVLKDCSYAFNGAGAYVLMGPNGCGKSTLLRICSLLERPDGGDLQFKDNSTPLVQDIALRRRMTIVLPRTGVFNTAVSSNVAYGLMIRNMQKHEINDTVQKALAFVGLEHKAKQNARTLSSGETQRLGIARALAIGPEILFLDEPTASVDEENTSIIEAIITSLKKDGRTMVIMTTHDRDQAERLADGLLVMKEGRIEEAKEGT